MPTDRLNLQCLLEDYTNFKLGVNEYVKDRVKLSMTEQRMKWGGMEWDGMG